MQRVFYFLPQVIVGASLFVFLFLFQTTAVNAETVYESQGWNGTTNTNFTCGDETCRRAQKYVNISDHIPQNRTFDKIQVITTSTTTAPRIFINLRVDRGVSIHQCDDATCYTDDYNVTEYGGSATGWSHMGNGVWQRSITEKTSSTSRYYLNLIPDSNTTYQNITYDASLSGYNFDGNNANRTMGSMKFQICDNTCDAFGTYDHLTYAETCTDCTYIRSQLPFENAITPLGEDTTIFANYQVRTQDIINPDNVEVWQVYTHVKRNLYEGSIALASTTLGGTFAEPVYIFDQNAEAINIVPAMSATGTVRVLHYIIEKIYSDNSWWEFWKEDQELTGTNTIVEDVSYFGYSELSTEQEQSDIINFVNNREEQEIRAAQESCVWSNQAMADCIRNVVTSATTKALTAPPFGYITRMTYILRNPATTTLTTFSLPISNESKLPMTTFSVNLASPDALMQSTYLSSTTDILGTTRSYYEHMMYYWDLMWRLAFALWILYTITGVGAKFSGRFESLHNQQLRQNQEFVKTKHER